MFGKSGTETALVTCLQFKATVKDVTYCQTCHSLMWNSVKWIRRKVMLEESEKQRLVTVNSS
jgi:hypothetical protein